MKIILSSLLSFMFVFLISETSQSPKSRGGEIVLKLNPPEGALKSSSDVRLYVSVKNVTDHEVGIVRSPGIIPEEQLRYQVDVRDSDGKALQETPISKISSLHRRSYSGAISAAISNLENPLQTRLY